MIFSKRFVKLAALVFLIFFVAKLVDRQHSNFLFVNNDFINYGEEILEKIISDDPVDQYKQKYNRSPPANFEKWLQMAKSYKCSLDLENYEQIERDMQAFRAGGKITKEMIEKAKSMIKTAVYHIDNGSFVLEREGDYVCRWDLLKRVAHLLPTNKRVTVVMSCQDELRVLPTENEHNNHKYFIRLNTSTVFIL
jgi:hypothetical protein